MKTISSILVLFMVSVPAWPQRPSNPALLVPENAPALDYVSVANPLTLPSGMTMGASSSVAFDSNGRLYVLTRGAQPIMEFDAEGRYIRGFGEGMFTRSHGLRVDSEGNVWATDVGAHTVMKFNPQGQLVLTLGTKGQAGMINEPNDVAIAPNGDVFVVQGHAPGPNRGDPRVLKFDRNGTFIKSWGGKGNGPGQFDVAHGIAIDARGQLWVTDRENQRIQLFSPDGDFIREIKYAGLPCGLVIGEQNIYMVNGFAGQIVQMDL
jgi:sugar lactone lactonase YvrE